LKSKVFDLVMDVRKASAEETSDEDSYLG
jgi:hypothetical protein